MSSLIFGLFCLALISCGAVVTWNLIVQARVRRMRAENQARLAAVQDARIAHAKTPQPFVQGQSYPMQIMAGDSTEGMGGPVHFLAGQPDDDRPPPGVRIGQTVVFANGKVGGYALFTAGPGIGHGHKDEA